MELHMVSIMIPVLPFLFTNSNILNFFGAVYYCNLFNLFLTIKYVRKNYLTVSTL
jgi:hypothetical protein